MDVTGDKKNVEEEWDGKLLIIVHLKKKLVRKFVMPIDWGSVLLIIFYIKVHTHLRLKGSLQKL